MKVVFLYFLTLITFVACQRRIPEQAVWSGTVHRTDGKDIPFQVFVNLRSTPPSGYFLVGHERTPVPEMVHHQDSLIFVFSEYNAEMRGVLDGDHWQGSYIRYRSRVVSIPFSAMAGSAEASTDLNARSPAIPLVGKYRAFLKRDSTVDTTSVATFWAKNDSIFGTLIAPDGDYGLNVGVQFGTSVSLARFTGWQAQLFELNQDGSAWKGTYFVRDEPPVSLTLKPRPSLPEKIEGGRETKIKNHSGPFEFSGITPAGDTLTNRSSLFKGKALIIDIMGTWCHNCMDEAPVLQQLYAEYKDKGLVVVGLSFEINDNPQLGKKNLALYQQRFGLTFPLLFCGGTEDKYVGPSLRAQMDSFYAYPTALFIDKKGRVQYVHIGFKGPGTGEEFQSEVQHMYDNVKRILR